MAGFAAVLLLLLGFIPATRAAEGSVLAGDEEIERWVREMQAEILFFASPFRARELGDMALSKANETWGNDRKWSQRYVLVHSQLALNNLAFDSLVDVNGQPADFPDKDKIFDKFFKATMAGMDQIGSMLASIEETPSLSRDEKEMVEILALASEARVYCYISEAFSNAPEDLSDSGRKSYKQAIKSLKKTSPENIANLIEGVKLAGINEGETPPTKDNLVEKLEEQRDLICGK